MTRKRRNATGSMGLADIPADRPEGPATLRPPPRRRFTDVLAGHMKATTKILILVPPLLGAIITIWYAVVPRLFPPEPPKPPVTVQVDPGGKTGEGDKGKGEDDKLVTEFTPTDVCVKATPEFVKEMPLSLTNAIGADSFPYWLKLTVANKCKDRVALKMNWDVKQYPPKPVIQFSDGEKEAPFKVASGETQSKIYDLSLERFSNDFPTKMDITVSWEVLDEQKLQIDTARAKIRLLPPDVYKWDLLDATDNAVPSDFVLASLTNWVRTLSDNKAKIAKVIEASLGDKTKPGNWIERAYQEMFGVEPPIRLVEGGYQFPPAVPRRILPPHEVLSGLEGDALEIALTMAAIAVEGASRGDKIGLVIISGVEGDSGEAQFLLAWETGQGKWRAIDTAKVNTQSFEENVEQASQRLTQVMSDPELADALGTKGAYVNKKATVFAVEFMEAFWNLSYKISTLPFAHASEVEEAKSPSYVPTTPASIPGAKSHKAGE